MEALHHLIRHFVPRPPSGEELAVFSLCLESLPQLEPAKLCLVNHPGQGSLVYPSQEFETRQWLSLLHEDRWRSENEAAEWAYETLEGQTVEALSVYRVTPLVPNPQQFGSSFCSWKSEHEYTATGQHCQIAVSTNIAQPAVGLTQEEQLSNQEADFLLNSFSISEHSPTFRLWQGSFLEVIGKKEQAILRTFSKGISATDIPFIAYSTGRSQVLLRVAAQFLGRKPLENISDAELLAALLPWGSRTLVFHHDMKIDGVELKFCFCYIKPLAAYPPVRIEFPAALYHKEGYHCLLDKLLAHFVLNPNTLL